jgi:hypothetical protein
MQEILKYSGTAIALGEHTEKVQANHLFCLPEGDGILFPWRKMLRGIMVFHRQISPHLKAESES